MMLVLLVAALANLSLVENTLSSDLNKTFIYNKCEYDRDVSVTVNSTTINFIDFNEEDERWRGYPTRVYVATNRSVGTEFPLFITATQQKGSSTWELPLALRGARGTLLSHMARTLCPHDAGSNATGASVQLSTASARNLTVDIRLQREKDFFLNLEQKVSVTVTPSSARYYYFSFEDQTQNTSHRNSTVLSSVIVVIESGDDLCAIVSIQNNSCPVFDNEQDVQYQGYHLTMTRNGGITLTRSMFPSGFFVVLIVSESDACSPPPGPNPPNGTHQRDGRTKTFSLYVLRTISHEQYVEGALVLCGLVALVATLVVLLAVTFTRCHNKEEILMVSEAAGPSVGADTEPAPAEDAPMVQPHPSLTRGDSVSDCDSITPEWPRRPVHVAGLSQVGSLAQNRRSDRYFWNALTVAVVYALPVVQLLYTYQSMVFQTGNQDLCYYNFLCAHPLDQLSDFNHVLSNAGYVALGFVFMLQTRCRYLRDRSQPKDVGIPEHTGMFYSMGLALVMEGLLSACYHLCPNKMNFQFDSSFMYVIAVLTMVKLYQNRHPDVNASAHSTFMLIAIIMTIGFVGIMFPSVVFWSVFTALHLGTCLALTLNIYYVGTFKFEWAVTGRLWRAVRERRRGALVPEYRARAALLAVANLANWALAGYGLFFHNADFARHLLAILMGNALLYTLFYVLMKLVHRERILPHTWLYLVLALPAWLLALHLFLDSKTKWSEAPAQSRRHNAMCSALQFYDSHDLWHLASATAMFLCFNMLLTVDDALRDTPRHLIPVF